MISEPAANPVIDTADVLLLQEVVTPLDETAERLAAMGFVVAHAASDMGLAIAVRRDSGLSVVEGSEATTELQPKIRTPSTFKRAAPKLSKRFRARGMISVGLHDDETDKEIVVATTHPVVPVRFRSRAKQVRRLADTLGHERYASGVILGGDMNHYPGPRAVDQLLETAAGMTRVEIGAEPTWRMVGSKSERLGRFAAFVARRPVESLDGQLDALFYRGDMALEGFSVEDVASDHRAIVAQFSLD